ncbi:MAG: hypothetical protein V1844_14940, partial [Pseudomonadota bacterium]
HVKIFIHNRVPTDFEEKCTALSGNLLFLQWPGRKNSRINAYRAGTQVLQDDNIGFITRQ